MVELLLPKQVTRVRFPSPAPIPGHFPANAGLIAKNRRLVWKPAVGRVWSAPFGLSGSEGKVVSYRELLSKGAYIYRHNRRTLIDKVNRNVIRLGNRRPFTELNEWQAAFCVWHAERTGLPEATVRERFLHSMNAVSGGHGGGDYRRFGMLSYAIYLPFASDDEGAVTEAYEFYKHLHFMRMLSYPLPRRPESFPVYAGIDGLGEVRVIDFGCGLAQKSIALVRRARTRGQKVRMSLADVSTLQLDFLSWFCPRIEIPVETFHCGPETPVPAFEPAHVLFAEEVLEHVHNPLFYVEELDRMVLPGGYMVANVGTHHKEFMHVSPDLAPARERLLALGYEELEPARVFRKKG